MAILLVLFLFRPGVHPLRNRIANSIGSALGRRVELESVRVHLLPRPGFDLSGLVIYDDPAFSAEPMVRADDVTASIRLRSLLRGRLEIANLSATEPSINLTRSPQGRWSLAQLIERTAHIPVAPTGKSPSEPRPAFPYLEATRARINFKFGQEKKALALTDADVALWQESENSWGARLTAQPMRTDLNLTDMGRVRVNATWQRAERMGETPFEATLRWDQGQLGQITKLLSGSDRGWRGDVSVSASMSGTPESMSIRTQATINDFRRYDIMGGDSVRLWAECSGRYSTKSATVADILCQSPVGSGMVRVRGSLGPIQVPLAYDLTVQAERVPLPSILRLARQGKKGLPGDLAATGSLDATLRAQKNGTESAQLSGGGSVSAARLASGGGKEEIIFGNVPFTMGATKSAKAQPLIRRIAESGPDGLFLQLGPFPLAMGGETAATAGGWVAASGYHFTLRGDTTLRSVFRLASTLGLPLQRPAATGVARVDMNLTGSWRGFVAPLVTGTAQLRNVRAEGRGFNPPIEIASAIVTLSPEETSIQKISAQTGSTRWTGSVTAPRICPSVGCPFQFNLVADELSIADLLGWFTSRPASRRWYGLLGSPEPQERSPLLAITATGSVRVSRLVWKKLVATQVQARLDVGHNTIAFTGLRGQLFQGTHQGNWSIDLSSQPPAYHGAGNLQNISLGSVSTLVGGPLATGTVDGKFELTGTGNSVVEVLEHAGASVQFIMRNGTLTHPETEGLQKPFPVHRFTGEMLLKNGRWELRAAKLESHDGVYQVGGTATSAGVLNLVSTRGDERSWNVTGTITKPRVTPAERQEVRSDLGAEGTRRR